MMAWILPHHLPLPLPLPLPLRLLLLLLLLFRPHKLLLLFLHMLPLPLLLLLRGLYRLVSFVVHSNNGKRINTVSRHNSFPNHPKRVACLYQGRNSPLRP